MKEVLFFSIIGISISFMGFCEKTPQVIQRKERIRRAVILLGCENSDEGYRGAIRTGQAATVVDRGKSARNIQQKY
ncbi:MAG: hypothetical protein JNM19_12465 [Chitinophagaceae bacterium]|nr:hypothetical protein [Chitinophagaceae bacterium]